MSATDPIRSTFALSSGAQFRRGALQVNPHPLAEKYRRQGKGLNDVGYAVALVDRAADLEIEVLAVINHNHVAGVKVICERPSCLRASPRAVRTLRGSR